MYQCIVTDQLQFRQELHLDYLSELGSKTSEMTVSAKNYNALRDHPELTGQVVDICK